MIVNPKSRSALENVVTWRRNGKVLKPGAGIELFESETQPKILVDTFNTLYLHDVAKEQEGNYTCFVDDVRMQQVVIFVVSKSKLLTEGEVILHVIEVHILCAVTTSFTRLILKTKDKLWSK